MYFHNFVLTKLHFFVKNSVGYDIILIFGQEELLLCYVLCILHIDSVLQDNFVPSSLVLKCCGVFLGNARVRTGVDSSPKVESLSLAEVIICLDDLLC